MEKLEIVSLYVLSTWIVLKMLAMKLLIDYPFLKIYSSECPVGVLEREIWNPLVYGTVRSASSNCVSSNNIIVLGTVIGSDTGRICYTVVQNW